MLPLAFTAVYTILLGGAYRMIARLWHGYTTPENADTLEEIIRTRVLSRLQDIKGFLGGRILRRNLFHEVEFVVVTCFSSLESVRAAAGDDFGLALTPDEGRRYLLRSDQRTAVYEVTVDVAGN